MTVNQRRSVAAIPALLAIGGWFFYWAAIAGPAEEHALHTKWHSVTAKVVAVSPVHGNTVENAFRVATLRYTGYFGKPQIVTIPMPITEHVGQTEPVIVGRNGFKYAEHDLQLYDDTNPLRNKNPLATIMMAFVLTWVAIAVVVWLIAYRLTGTRPAEIAARLVRVTRKLVFRLFRILGDELKLRWEFRRRKKHLRPSPAYKTIRRFQAELARMDPTPSVSEARRQANQLLTNILERDNRRVEDIVGMIDGIRKEVSQDLQARELARRELG